MRIINYDGSQIAVLDDEDTRLEHGIEDLFSKEDFKQFFGIDYDGYLTVVYEPYRNMYVVEKIGGEVEAYDDPTKEPILNKIKMKEDDIMDYLVLRHLKKEIPSKFHRIENYKYVLPKEFEEAYQKQLEEKEAHRFLMESLPYAIRELEEALHPAAAKTTASLAEDPIMVMRQEAYSKISREFWEKKSGLTRALAGCKKPVEDMSPEELKKSIKGEQ